MWDGTNDDLEPEGMDEISIHPSRVGWDLILIHTIDFILISIHPSRVGWDAEKRVPCGTAILFQSTHPVWDGTQPHHGSFFNALFQSTHPVWDGTCDRIHRYPPVQDFNPPIPCGMGPASASMSANGISSFQSTHPVWDGTAKNI